MTVRPLGRRPLCMGLCFALALLLSALSDAFGQGQLVFNNRVNGILVAPIYNFDPAQPTLRQHGNTPAGYPSGDVVYSGERLTGAKFTAQLFGGSLRAAIANLQPISPTVTFRLGAAVGFVVAPPVAVVVPGVPAGESARLVLRAWENAGGTITNWLQVMEDTTVPHGESLPIVTSALGGPFSAPPNLVGLQSFNLATGRVERLDLKVNFQPSNAVPVLGYATDDGALFHARSNGLVYGWNVDHAAFARESNATNSLDQRHDTFVEMQTNAVWEIEVPNGMYGVHAVAGNPRVSTNSAYRIHAEGVPVVFGNPAPGTNWIAGDAVVEVSDGRLTLSSGAGAVSNVVCFIEISRLAAPRVLINRGTNTTFTITVEGDYGPDYVIEGSMNLVDWNDLAAPAAVGGARFELSGDSSAAETNQFFRARTLVSPAAGATTARP